MAQKIPLRCTTVLKLSLLTSVSFYVRLYTFYLLIPAVNVIFLSQVHHLLLVHQLFIVV